MAPSTLGALALGGDEKPARTYIKGAMGPVRVSRASLHAIGAPEDWSAKSKEFLAALQSRYPALSPGFPDRRELPAG